VSDADREIALGQHALTLWLTGLSGSGKSSIAQALEKRLYDAGFHTYSLDGDNVRFGLNRDLAFSKQDRQENIRRVAEVARLLNQAGIVVLVPVISPFRDDRRGARDIIGSERFFEIYVDAPLEVCEGRDVKGLYQKARAGEIDEFTGISSPYEPPDNPSLRIQTADRSVEDCMEEVFEAVFGRIKREDC
jgi:adenylyl-sulfate kinase